MENRVNPFDDSPDYAVTCDICGAAIAMGADYVNIAAEDESGAIIGTLIAHAHCAEHLDREEIAALVGATVGSDSDALETVLPLERCCLCGERIDDR